MDQVYLEYLGDSIELPVGETVVGRDVGCLLRFNDPAVSRRHLRFIRRQDEVFVEDLGSSNGTLLNGRRLAAAVRIEDGDTICVGSRLMTMHVTEDDPTAAATLLLKNVDTIGELMDVEAVQGLKNVAATNDRKIMRAVTAQMAVMLPPESTLHQQCPQCAAPVSELDDACAKCNYQWGSFRPKSVTDVRPSPVNRRRHDRLPIELSLVYISSELEIEAMTRDLSESGVFVCSQVLDQVGTRCELTILVDGGPPLQIHGVVRRVVEHQQVGGEPIGLGVEFIGVGQHELAWIKTTLARMVDDDGYSDDPSNG